MRTSHSHASRNRRRFLPFDPAEPPLCLLPARAGTGDEPDGPDDPTLGLLAEGGMEEEAIDRLRLFLRFRKLTAVAELLKVCRGQASRLRRSLLNRARRILLADLLRSRLHLASEAVLEVATGTIRTGFAPKELVAAGSTRRTSLRLAKLARVIGRAEREWEPGRAATHLCAERVAGGCVVWPALLPECDWILPFAPQAQAEVEPPVILPMFKAA
jgi:hypothetical protein